MKYLGPASPAIPEPVISSFILQLLGALKAYGSFFSVALALFSLLMRSARIHSAGLACRVIHASKILVTGKHRVRVNGAGMLDVLQPDQKPMAQQQAEDILSLGKLVLALATKTPNPVHNNVPKLIEVRIRRPFSRSLGLTFVPFFLSQMVGSTYSPELKNWIILLLRQPMTVDEVTAIVAGKALGEIEQMQLYADNLEHELSSELENGRLLRLMVKLGFINERPECVLVHSTLLLISLSGRQGSRWIRAGPRRATAIC